MMKRSKREEFRLLYKEQGLKCPMVLSLTFCFLLVSVFSRQIIAAEKLAITNVTLIDGTGAPPLADMIVIIESGRIAELGRVADICIPKDAMVVHAEGKFLIPGLWDMHVHLSLATSSALPALVANGVIGIRDMGGDLQEIDSWRNEIIDGNLTGPRIVRSGPTVNGQQVADHHLMVESAGEARGAVRTLHKVGVDFIKIHNALSREAYFAVADESKRLGIPFAGHIPKVIDPLEAVEAGQASFEHTETFFEGSILAKIKAENLIEAIAEWRKLHAAAFFNTLAEYGIACTPTLVAYRASSLFGEKYAEDPRNKYIARSAVEKAKEWFKPLPEEMVAGRKLVLEEFKKLAGIMHRSGVLLMTGTDLAVGFIYPGFSVHEEMALFVDAGLSPMDSLLAATRNPAEFLGILDQRGTIAKNKIADMVLLEDNPLDDIKNVSSIWGVVLDGRYLDRLKLDDLLIQSEALAKSN